HSLRPQLLTPEGFPVASQAARSFSSRQTVWQARPPIRLAENESLSYPAQRKKLFAFRQSIHVAAVPFQSEQGAFHWQSDQSGAPGGGCHFPIVWPPGLYRLRPASTVQPEIQSF